MLCYCLIVCELYSKRFLASPGQHRHPARHRAASGPLIMSINLQWGGRTRGGRGATSTWISRGGAICNWVKTTRARARERLRDRAFAHSRTPSTGTWLATSPVLANARAPSTGTVYDWAACSEHWHLLATSDSAALEAELLLLHGHEEGLGWHYLSNATCLIRPRLFSTALLV